MQKYELTVVLPGKTTAAKKKNAVSRIEKIVETLGGKIIKSEDWGEKELAYKIAKNTSGVYLYFELEITKKAISGLNDKIKLEDGIIRHLLVRKES